MPESTHSDATVVDHPVAAAPKLNSGVDAAQKQSHTAKPARARTRRKPGQEPQTEDLSQPYVQSLAKPTCPGGHPVTSAMKFCPQCGLAIPDPSKPPQCRNGHEVSLADKFCAMCGASMAEVPPESGVREYRPAGELSDAERADRERQHVAAVRLGKEMPAVVYTSGSAPPGVPTVIIHILQDGFCVFGQVWMRGQELEVWEGHPRWHEMQRLLREDVSVQYARYGRQMFGMGLWPGAKSYTAGAGKFQPLKQISGDGEINQPTEEELARADEAERRRGRRVPLPLR